ncbi:MAG: hypothetical protein KZQ98_02705 [Candidatus Thiodiazotropha sp. (ex Lucinoma borealis)]|nr:hypothetical protein [Candidatus Thiodiazotropha sp. (ex Lucinoma borealis)]
MKKNTGSKPSSPHKKQATEIPTVSKVFDDGRILEMVYNPDDDQTTLVQWKDGSWQELKKVQISPEKSLIPYSPHNNLIAHHVVLFPSAPLEYGTPQALLNDIRTYIRRYVDISPEFEHIAAYYALFTWIHDAFNELPYLRARGDYGSGKTRLLLIIGSICYKPIFASGASTVSPIFHILDSLGGTLLIDEADFRFSDEKSDIVKILNNGNVRGFPVLRSELAPTKEFNPRAFHVFGPKLVATRGYYTDRALESRFITEELGGQPIRSDIPINLPSVYQEEARTLRNKLLLYRFRMLHNAHVNTDHIDRRLEPRFNQIFTPLTSVIEDETMREHLFTLAKRYQDDTVADRSQDTEAQVLTIIEELARTNSTLSVKEVTDQFSERYGSGYEHRITPRWIGSIIRRNLKLRTRKSNGVYVLQLSNTAKLKQLYERYGVTISGLGDFGDVRST